MGGSPKIKEAGARVPWEECTAEWVGWFHVTALPAALPEWRCGNAGTAGESGGQPALRRVASVEGRGEPMSLFVVLARLAEELAGTGSKLKKRAAIAGMLTAVRADGEVRDAGLFAQYLAGTPFAEADGRKLNVGGAMMSRAVRLLTEPSEAEFTEAYRRHGDMGAAAGDLWAAAGRVPEASVTYGEVETAFAGMAVAKTTAIRQELLVGLLGRATPIEAKYLIKLMLGDMRIGVKQALIEEAVAEASGQPVGEVRHAVMLEADLADAVRLAFEGRLGEARMRLFHPLGFMLASPVDTTEEVVKRFAGTAAGAAEAGICVESEEGSGGEPKRTGADAVESAGAMGPVRGEPMSENPGMGHTIAHAQIHLEAQIEDKFDGMRVQLHCGEARELGRVALYSRNREDVTGSYPEICEAFARVTAEVLEDGGGGLILDGEVLAWDVTGQKAMPFAVLSPRIGRKKVTNEVRTGTPVVFMAFDVLCVDGELVLDRPLRERRALLEAVAAKARRVTCSPLALPAPLPKGGLFADCDADEPRGEQRLLVSAVNLARTAEDLDRAYVAARDRGNEGVMIKASGSLYQPGRRGISWVKLKRTLDTLDVVITGAEYGSGRKSQVLSDYTFAVRDADGSLKNVGKAYSGVTDAEIAELTEWLKAHTVEDYGHFRTVEPLMMLEVAFNNVMRSDRHASGFALRFPRIVQIRRDKPVEEIDTVARVEEIYQTQPDRPVEGFMGEQKANPRG